MSIATSNQPPEHDIYVANGSEVEQVCNILANAFTNDPVLDWLSGHPKIYASFFRSEAEALYKHHQQLYINKEKTGAAMWLPAGISTKPPFHWRLLHVAWNLARTGGVKSLKRGSELEKIMVDHHPKEPHFYLHAIGATQNNQGRGIGSALIKKGLTVCDQQGLPVYLESSNEKNNPLYERYGFEILDKKALPDGGPNIWFMRREARLANS